MNSPFLKIIFALLFVSIAGAQAQAEGSCVVNTGPWLSLTSCNQGEYSVEFRDLSPTGHQSCQDTTQEYRMVLKGALATQAAATDDKLAQIIASADGVLEAKINGYKANASISLCEDANCAFGPNFVVAAPQGGAKRQLQFYRANLGGASQVGQTMELDCTGSPDSK